MVWSVIGGCGGDGGERPDSDGHGYILLFWAFGVGEMGIGMGCREMLVVLSAQIDELRWCLNSHIRPVELFLSQLVASTEPIEIGIVSMRHRFLYSNDFWRCLALGLAEVMIS